MVFEISNRSKIISPPLLIFSTFIIYVLMKFMNGLYGKGDSIYLTHYFYKPWFQTTVIFIGMSLTLIYYEIYRKIKKINAFEESIDTRYVKDSHEEKQRRWIFYVIPILPGFFRVISTVIINISLIYLNVSVVQAFQTTTIIYTILIDKFFRRKCIQLYQWCSLALGVAQTGFLIGSSILSCFSGRNVAIGLCLIVLAQGIKSSTYFLESSLFRTYKVHATLCIGLEGLWGFLILFAILLPFANISRSKAEGYGIHEDLLDTFKMFANNLTWIAPEAFILLFSISYAISHVNIASQENPQQLPFFEACTAFLVWIFETILFYSLRNSEFGQMHPMIGEHIGINSLLTLLAYLSMVLSVVIYSKLLPFRWLYPPVEDVSAMMETQREIQF